MNFFLKKLSGLSGAGAKLFFAGLAIFFAFGPVFALDPERAIAQFKQEKWGLEDGFSGDTVYAMAQTSDGYLWIGCDKGLVRFDGLNFQIVQQRVLPLFYNEPVLGLLVDGEDNLWVRLGRSAVLRYRDGKFNIITNSRQRPIVNVTAMSLETNGNILLSTLQGELLEYSTDNIFVPVTGATIPNQIITSMVSPASGETWLGTRDSGLIRIRDGETAIFNTHLPDVKINCLLPDGERGLWIGTDKGLARWDGEQLTIAGVPAALENVQILTMIKDRDQNIWCGTDKLGLARISPGGTVTTGKISADLPPEKSAGLTSGEPATASTALFEDREGNLWEGGAQGITRLSDSIFTTFSAAEELPSENNGAIYVDRENRLWFAPLTGGLYRFQDHRVEQITDDGLAHDIVYAIGGSGDDVWVGRQRGGLTNLHLHNNYYVARTHTANNGLAQASVYTVHQNFDGSVWAGTLSGGVSLFKNGSFVSYTTANGLASNMVSAIAEMADGTAWFATPTGLSAFKDGVWRTLKTTEGLPSENIISLFADSSGMLWIGTAKGLALIDSSGRTRSLAAGAPLLAESILGIAEDQTGDLWISTSDHVLHLARAALANNQISDEDVRSYTQTDGLQAVGGVKRSQTVVPDPAGRIWFSLKRGISMVDAGRLGKISPPAIVKIQSVAVDASEVEIIESMVLPPARQRLTFSYSGISLTHPDRVKFRYYLKGFDQDWSEPNSANETSYTNLGPGTYVFQVIACNSDGLWNSTQATIRFEIAPAYWQTWWFRLLILIAVVLALIGLYRLRLRHLTDKLQRRFDERLAERTRIAQELHDSLLQGVVSASMQLNVAVDNLPGDSPSKSQLTHVIQLMRRVIQEGRNTLRGLRSSPDDEAGSLEKAFAELRPETNGGGTVEFRLHVEGLPQALRPITREEVFSIGREALINAYRHSNAGKIEIVVEYTSGFLRIAVRDDGLGIEPQILQHGREGHWGLTGMRERAKKIGARIKIRSFTGTGTEIELIVPNRIAFEKISSRRPLERILKSPFRKWKVRRERMEQQ